MSQRNVTLLHQPVDQEAWILDVGSKPEIYCIHGPYINQRITRAIYGSVPDDLALIQSLATTHHDAHWDHPPGRRGSVSPSEVKRALKTNGEVRDDCTFVMRADLKTRKEMDGYLISDNNTAYFINNTGYRLLEVLRTPTRTCDVKTLCERLGIPEPAGIEFFRRLVTFGLCRPL